MEIEAQVALHHLGKFLTVDLRRRPAPSSKIQNGGSLAACLARLGGR